MKARVSSERISGPLSDTANGIGAVGSDRFTSSGRSRRHSRGSRSPSASSAFKNSTLTWVEVASAQCSEAIHLRDTTSTMP